MASTSRQPHAGNLSILLRLVVALFVAMLSVPIASATVANATTTPTASAGGSCDPNDPITNSGKVDTFSQNTRQDESGDWINGIVNVNKGPLYEGQFVPQRLQLINMVNGSNTLVFESKLTENGLHAYDFIPAAGDTTYPNFTPKITGGSIDTWNVSVGPVSSNGDQWATITVTFTVSASSVELKWYPHIASELDWGPGTGAGSINGGPYHNKIDFLNCASIGSKDNQIMAGAIHYATINVIKDAQPDSPTDFHFSITPGGAASTFDLDDDNDPTLPNTLPKPFRVAPTTDYTITEVNIPAEWDLVDIQCVNTGNNTTTKDLANNRVVVHTADLSNGSLQGTTICTFINKPFQPHWTLQKTAAESDGNNDGNVLPGDTVTYTLTATNDSKATVAGATASDDLSGVLTYADPSPDLAAMLGGGTTLTWHIPTMAPGSDPQTLSYTVKVKDGAWGVHIHNLATPDDTGTCVNACSTDHFTPKWVLHKTSVESDGVQDGHVMPGDTITYTLRVDNVGPAPITSATVTDDLRKVLDDATVIDNGGLSIANGIATWTVAPPTIPVGGSATVSYTVRVNAGAWKRQLDNVATPGEGGFCLEPSDCTTHHETPPVGPIVVKKVDFETGAVLAGAKFQLWLDRGAIGTFEPGVDQPLGAPATSNASGLARWDDLLADDYLVEETAPPPGYALPAGTVQQVHLDFSRNYVTNPLVFKDPSVGNLAIVEKRQFEFVNGAWVPSDGVTDFGKTVRYVVEVEATGTRLFHKVKVTDWVPGFNPDDTHVFGTGSTMKASLIPGSARCIGYDCTIHVGANNLVTWTAGLVKNAHFKVQMDVTFPAAPTPIPFDQDGIFKASLWNVGFLDYDTAVANTPGSRIAAKALPTVHTHLVSNEVVIKASIAQGPPIVHVCTRHCLPNTGSAPYLMEMGALGGLAILAGAAMLARGRRRGEVAE